MKKDAFFVVIIAFIITAVVLCTKIQSVDEYYLTHLEDIEPNSQTVFLSVRCDTILNNWDKLDSSLKSEEYVPSSGIILPRKELVLRDGDTAFSILQRALKFYKIQFDATYTPGLASSYVKSINHLYEFSCGALSGWMFYVDDSTPGTGSSTINLKDGAEVVWAYTCDLGRDLNNKAINAFFAQSKNYLGNQNLCA